MMKLFPNTEKDLSLKNNMENVGATLAVARKKDGLAVAESNSLDDLLIVQITRVILPG
jgi:hypothetical protein